MDFRLTMQLAISSKLTMRAKSRKLIRSLKIALGIRHSILR